MVNGFTFFYPQFSLLLLYT